MAHWENYWKNQTPQIKNCLAKWRQSGKAQMKLSDLSDRQDLYRQITINAHGRVKGGSGCSHLLALAKVMAPLLGSTEQVTARITTAGGQDYLDLS
jgi:hypothetical protein